VQRLPEPDGSRGCHRRSFPGYNLAGEADRAADKKQAIEDILQIRDYKAFYEKSGLDKQFN